jgi:hypothetical protein
MTPPQEHGRILEAGIGHHHGSLTPALFTFDQAFFFQQFQGQVYRLVVHIPVFDHLRNTGKPLALGDGPCIDLFCELPLDLLIERFCFPPASLKFLVKLH